MLPIHYAKTTEKLNEDTKVLKEALEVSGISKDDFKTTDYFINTHFEEDDEGSSKFVGYTYTHSGYVEFLNDNEKLGRLIFELSNLEVDIDFSVEYTVSDHEVARSELLKRAAENAKEKAKLLTQT